MKSLCDVAGFCSNSWFLPLLNCFQVPRDLSTPLLSPGLLVWVLFVGPSYDISVIFLEKRKQCCVFVHFQLSFRPAFLTTALECKAAQSLFMEDSVGTRYPIPICAEVLGGWRPQCLEGGVTPESG